MRQQLPVLVVALPLTAALAAPLAGRLSARAARWLALVALTATLAAALVALRLSLGGVLRYSVAGWPPPLGIELAVDPLGALVAVLVAGFGALVAWHGTPWPDRLPSGLFWALYLLLVAGLIGIAVTGDVFNLFVFLEISALAGYALLGAHDARCRVASFRYLLVGTLAGSFYLLGVGYLYALTGTLNMADLAARLPAVRDSPLLAVATALITVGLAAKCALFPLHGWLPDAYAYAPPSLVAFVAAVMSKVAAYALRRILYFVMGATGPAATALGLLGWAAALAALAGSAMALAQSDFRRLLAYSSVGQMGYIFMGFSIGNAAALTGALLHVVNHAVMKGGLFLVAAGVLWRRGGSRLADFDSLARAMPATAAALAVFSLSMVGLPPSAGFFSKYYLALGAIEAGAWPLLAALVASTLLGVAYFLRLLERVYHPGGDAAAPESGELPPRMLLPILGLASAVLLLGLFNQWLAGGVIRHALPPGLR